MKPKAVSLKKCMEAEIWMIKESICKGSSKDDCGQNMTVGIFLFLGIVRHRQVKKRLKVLTSLVKEEKMIFLSHIFMC